jgi:hypothetical protein
MRSARREGGLAFNERATEMREEFFVFDYAPGYAYI